MTTPTHSAFTVTVPFQGIVYDVEITPILNDEPLPWIGDRVAQWESAETTHRLFSQKIVEMLNNSEFPADYSLATHGLITTGSEDGFTFEKGLGIEHKTQKVWDEFIDCLQDPVSRTAGVDPVEPEEVELPAMGLGTRMRFIREDYLSLDAGGQKVVRLRLFEKLCFEFYAQESKLVLPADFKYTKAEKACLSHHLYRNPAQEKMSCATEAKKLWTMQKAEEQREMDTACLEIKALIARQAKAAAEAAVSDSDDDSLSV